MNKEQFHALYERHARDVHRFAYHLTASRTQAEDLCADAFVRAWLAIDVVRTETVKAYLFSIVRNVVRERQRGARRERFALDHVPDPRPGPASQAGDRIELDAAVAALQRLPADDRAALLLCAEHGLSHEEIGRVLGVSAGTVKVRIHRARLRLAVLKIRQERSP